MKNDFREFYDEDYILHSMTDDYIAHAWKTHKYLYIDKNGNYVYPEDLYNKGKKAAIDVGNKVRGTVSAIRNKLSPYVRTGLNKASGVLSNAKKVLAYEKNRRKLMAEGKLSNIDPDAKINKNIGRRIFVGDTPGKSKFTNQKAINNIMAQRELNMRTGKTSKTLPAMQPGEKWQYDSKQKVWRKISSRSSSSKKKNQITNSFRTDRLKDDFTPNKNKKTYGGLDTNSARNEKFRISSKKSTSGKKNAKDILNSYANIGKRASKDAKTISGASKNAIKNAAKAIGNKYDVVEKEMLKKYGNVPPEDLWKKITAEDLATLMRYQVRNDPGQRAIDRKYRVRRRYF